MTTQNPFGMGLQAMGQLANTAQSISNRKIQEQRQQMLQEQSERDVFQRQQQDLFNTLSNIRGLPDIQSRMQAIQSSPFANMPDIDMLMNEAVLSDEGLDQILAASPFAQPQQEDPFRLGTYNPRDYTTESWAEFLRTEDPSALVRYYPMRQQEIGGVTYNVDERGNLYLPVQPTGDGQVVPGQVAPDQVAPGHPSGVGQTMPSETPVAPDQQPQFLTPEQQIQLEVEKRAKIKAAEEKARQEVKSESPEEIEKRRLQEQELSTILSLIDRLSKSEDLGKISGPETNIPLVGRAKSFFSQDTLNDLNTLKNLLTLGNLGRMSGPLSDPDIALISNAASGITIGDYGTPISEERLREILKDIKSRISEGIRGDSKELISDPSEAQSLDDLEMMLRSKGL